jgi:glycosyltransferase involved in cell wall biosynthesis
VSAVRIMVLGVRGIPAVQGGIETHAEQLYQRLANLGVNVEVIVRTPFVPASITSVGSIRLRRIWSPTARGYETLVHSLLGVLYAGITRPDVLHIHAVGPAIVTPLARLLGLRVVVTNHGPDYDRDKWGPFPKWVLRTGESLGMRFSQARIVISRVIQDLVRTKYQLDSDLIPNGSVPVSPQSDTREIERFGLERGRYFLQVSRIVPEKRQLDLIEAYRLARPAGWKLVLVGATGNDSYSQAVLRAAKEAGVIMAGFQRGLALAQFYSHAGAFVLPSSHEGLPIAILEALSFGLPVVASEIPANREMNLGPSSYFPVGDIPALAARLTQVAAAPQTADASEARRHWVAETYDWERIARQTHSVYLRVLGLQSQAPLEHEGHKA